MIENPGYDGPAPAAAGAGPALVIHGLSKSFLGNPALMSFDLAIPPGDIHVLVGQNGSGKSTLIKVLSGYHLPDPGGEVLVGGQRMHFGSPDSAYRLGCRFVHQDLGLIPSSSVLDNLSYSAGYPTRLGTIRSRAAISAAREALSRVGLDVDPRRKVATLSAAERTGVAVARALREDIAHPPLVLVLDEPTATLPAEEVSHLLATLRSAAASKVAVLFVTHRLDEVFRIADFVTVLRDGRQVGTFPIGLVDRETLVERLVGAAVPEVQRSPDVAAAPASRPPLIIEDLRGERLRGITFSAGAGQIVGVAGLDGSGRESLLSTIFGAQPRDGGRVEVNGTVLAAHRPDSAIRAGAGFLPADRAANGGVMALSATENLTLANLRPFWSGLRLRKRSELAVTRQWFQRLQVRPESAVRQPLATFSGGNQQKILLGKWLHLSPAVMLLDEPTQGVDVGAQADIHQLLLTMAGEGTTLVVSSTDIEELAAICDRVLVIRDGRIIRELAGDEANSAAITHCIVSEPVS